MKFKSTLSAVAIAGMLVITADYAAMAATGGGFLLGRSNTADRVTTLTNSGTGPVLKLWTTHPGTRPPLGVNSSVKVTNLNADKVDGKSAAALGVRTLLFTRVVNTVGSSGFEYTLNAVPAGTYLTTFNAGINGPVGGSLDCLIEVPSTFQSIEDYGVTNADGLHTISQAGVLVVPTTQQLHFECFGLAGTYTNWGNQKLQISLTRIDSLTPGTFAIG